MRWKYEDDGRAAQGGAGRVDKTIEIEVVVIGHCRGKGSVYKKQTQCPIEGVEAVGFFREEEIEERKKKNRQLD